MTGRKYAKTVHGKIWIIDIFSLHFSVSLKTPPEEMDPILKLEREKDNCGFYKGMIAN